LIYSSSRERNFFIQSIDYVILNCRVNNRLCTAEYIRVKPKIQFNLENSLQCENVLTQILRCLNTLQQIKHNPESQLIIQTDVQSMNNRMNWF